MRLVVPRALLSLMLSQGSCGDSPPQYKDQTSKRWRTRRSSIRSLVILVESLLITRCPGVFFFSHLFTSVYELNRFISKIYSYVTVQHMEHDHGRVFLSRLVVADCVSSDRVVL